MNRALRRKLKLKYWYKRIKIFYRLGDKRIPCDNENELPAHEKKHYLINTHHWKDTESWKDLKINSIWAYKYKNTGTIYSRSYWSKYERRLLNKKQRQEAKQEIRNYDENNI